MRWRAPTLPEPEPGDLALAQRMLAGDREAFESFFDGHFPGLYRFTLARLRDPDLACDVVQSALCKAVAHLRTYRGEATLAAWLFTICRHEISAHFRQHRREPGAVELAEEDAEVRAALDSLPVSFEGPEEALAGKELAELVHTTLDHLPPRYAQALEWKYLDGLPVVEIAQRLQIGPKAAESLLTRARGAFRDAFAALRQGFERFRPELA
jgi:RNA polymerase sigma-70 factor (ECF subfamily)